MSLDVDGHATSRRKALKVAVAALTSEVGFGMAEESALETLVEALQAYIAEIGHSTRAYAELGGRTEPMVSDVVITLVDMGLDIRGIPTHAKRANKSVFIPPAVSSHNPTPKTLQVGERRPHPTHIPDHLPSFPDPHTYIKTDAVRQPFNEYQLIRERAATQKRDVERALTRLIARTGETQSLFKDDFSAYPLIAVKDNALPLMDALLPKDQDLDSQEQEVHPTKSSTSTALPPSAMESSSSAPGLEDNGDSQMGGATMEDASQFLQSQDSNESETIDNPYLRGVRLPRRKRVS
ncbi:transcription initiation factor TFIID subunit 8-like [Babylonia areolata]|uniref:transcription initiation factor TFIID subunit 8-like n=1 Tax=Babylonia areolata TaxID=304850 RepID=UPI003FD14F8F